LETGIYNISLLRSGDPGRQGTLICVVTVDTSQLGHARHTHFGNYHGYLKYVCVCVLYFRSLRGNPNNVYRFISAPREPLCNYRYRSSAKSVRLNSVHWRLLPTCGGPWNSNVQPSDITCHLEAVRRTVHWKCGIWI
jgi:hypothetical protein